MNRLLDQRLPREYVIKKFFEFGYKAQYNQGNDTYNCSCPICHEGKSFGKKKRCWYLPQRDLIYCFNCGWSSRPLRWIEEAGGLSYTDIINEVEEKEYNFINLDKSIQYSDINIFLPESYNENLPEDAINLVNPLQVQYYQTNSVVLNAIKYLENRRLLDAINRPEAYYLSLFDPIHQNRLIIPFYDKNNKVVFYQSRAFGGNLDGYNEDIRYLSKKATEKSLFGANHISDSIPYLFLFEGPFDASFTINGLATGGINLSQNNNFTLKQEEQLRPYQYTHKFIWMLDSQWLDKTAKKKSELLLQANESIFFWPKELGMKYKDFNEMCIDKQINEVPVDFIKSYIITGQTGLLKFNLAFSI